MEMNNLYSYFKPGSSYCCSLHQIESVNKEYAVRMDCLKLCMQYSFSMKVKGMPLFRLPLHKAVSILKQVKMLSDE